MEEAATDAGPDRPFVFAGLTIAGAAMFTGLVILGSGLAPETVLIGLDGRHDAPSADEERMAGCLDCHVPFVGTPPSRCLSPGCHGALATGTPPRTGPAMPVRFHAALRDVPCRRCHLEHGPRIREKGTPFTHDIVPEESKSACSHCHSGARTANHAPTDAVDCGLCHEVDAWRGVNVDHTKVWQTACDSCHVTPSDEAHGEVAGACSTCHVTETWKPNLPTEEPKPQ